MPLAIAALDSRGQLLVEQAITESDNDAASALWRAARPAREAAAAAVEPVLAAAGDTETRVQTEVVHPPYTSFGQTEWTLAAQAAVRGGPLSSRLAPSRPRADAPVVPEQRWGFGAVTRTPRSRAAGARTGGPPPRPPVRDLQLSGRTVAAAIANEPEDGTYEAGAANLTRIADWVRRESVGAR